MSENPKITFDLKEYLQGMEERQRKDTERILEDSKQRHENHEAVTKANFEALGAKYESVEKTVKSTHDSMNIWIGILCAVIAACALTVAIVIANN